MNRYVIINSKKSPKTITVSDAPVYKTEYAGHALALIRDICQKDPDAEIHIYGGDGSVFEAVNAVMASGNSDRTSLVVHPFGTGNDFARNFSETEQKKPATIDLIKFNEQYAANEINIGFDCDVVAMTRKVKKLPLLKGGLAYMIAALLTLFKKMGKDFDLSYTDIDGSTGILQGNLLLCLIANGGFYGGGFHCAPCASLNDGYLEFITVDKISRLRFLSILLKFRQGKHLSPDGTVPEKYRDILHYRRVKSVSFHNIGSFCADGEIFACDELTVSIKENAFRISVDKKAK